MATRRGPDNTVRWSVSGLYQGVSWANIFWCLLTTSGTPTQSDLDTWLTSASTAFKNRFSAQQQTGVSYTQAQANLFLPGGLSLPSIVAMTGAGTGTNVATDPASCSAVISWQTGVYWRGGKPRTYIAGPPAGNRDDKNSLSSGGVTTYLSAGGAFRTDINALTTGAITGTSLGFVSFRSANADRTPPVFFAFSGVKVHPRLGTQRRRLGKWLP